MLLEHDFKKKKKKQWNEQTIIGFQETKEELDNICRMFHVGIHLHFIDPQPNRPVNVFHAEIYGVSTATRLICWMKKLIRQNQSLHEPLILVWQFFKQCIHLRHE